MNLTIALAGNPNSGKSTLFNELTGARQTVGNWPGVTVEKKVGTLRGFSNIQIIDLPGTYSLDSSSLEEIIAVRALRETPPDLILNVVDGTNLQRSLYLSLQLRELDTPMIVAVNMQHEVYRDGGQIDHQ
ncbi:MAG TPA: FeoB small GTPase domain-containing protein, partial [Bellilinea sp.]|nr:FeoB small GTPase domain-containing protein [Bellilinea sp.]